MQLSGGKGGKERQVHLYEARQGKREENLEISTPEKKSELDAGKSRRVCP